MSEDMAAHLDQRLLRTFGSLMLDIGRDTESEADEA